MEQTHSPLKGSTWQSTVSPSRGHDVLPAGHRAWSQVLTKLSGKEPATNRSVKKTGGRGGSICQEGKDEA